MIIAATSDVHSPRFFNEFLRAVELIKAKPDLFLLSGDMIDRGEVAEYEKINNTLFGKFDCPIIACFGNNEYPDVRENVKKSFKDIKFLDDDMTILNIKGISVGIVGSTGSLDNPTSWQRANIQNIELIYKNRIATIDRFLQRVRADFTILMTHYSPTYKSLEGENARFFGGMGTQFLEPVLLKRKPSLVIHGHAHRGSKKVWIETIPVYDVALPLNKEIVIIDTEKDLKPGITKFI